MLKKSILKALFGAKGIECYVGLFPRLGIDHIDSLVAEKEIGSTIAALRQAAHDGPMDEAAAFEDYRRRGELLALKRLAHVIPNFDWASEYAEWQRRIQTQLSQIDDRANLCHRERVICPKHPSWLARMAALREELEFYPDNPACQDKLVKECLDEIVQALAVEKDKLLARAATLLLELEKSETVLEAADFQAARSYLTNSRNCVERNDFVVGCRRLEQAEAILRRDSRGRNDLTGASRLPLPRRVYPRVEAKRRTPGDVRSPFVELLEIARRGAEISSPDMSRLLPDSSFVSELCDPDGFFVKHSRLGSQEWGSYFKSMRIWLGQRAAQKLMPPMPSLMPNNNFWSEAKGPKAIFARAQLWQGAPFYADREGQGRIIGIMHMALPREHWRGVAYVEQYVARAVQQLMADARRATSPEEVAFANQGLILVLLPGDFLSLRPYRQFHDQIRPGSDLDIKNRLAIIDDLDFLRILSLDSDARFRGLLELALPRFLNAYQQTYQDSNAVTPMMFFGREKELAVLDSKVVTVLFSGRKMGKSSLLRHLFQRCQESADRRAVWVGCAGIAPWRSWRLLEDITQGIRELMVREGFDDDLAMQVEDTVVLSKGAVREAAFHGILDRVKSRFRQFLANALDRLRSKGFTRLFILLDEADSFARAEWIENSGGDFQGRGSVSWFLRDREADSQGALRIVFAGYDELGRKENLCHSAFGNWGEMVKLGPLEEPAAQRLIIEPLAALGILVDMDLADRILDYTSGHASLIQAFCGQLVNVVRRDKQDWPLQDVTLLFDDLLSVANEPDYQQQAVKTLGLNLGIARTYPLELVFYALVSPLGLGRGKRLSMEGFTLLEAEGQMKTSEPLRAFSLTTLEAALELLVQLGLLDSFNDESSRKYRFRARHYVSTLRSQNAFSERVQHARESWNQLNNQPEATPRHVWTIPDDHLATLFNLDVPVCVVCGLNGSGREFLADLLARGDGMIRTSEPSWQDRLDSALNGSDGKKRVVVLDPQDSVPWPTVQEILTQRGKGKPSLRWIAGASTAWELCGDMETFLSLEPVGMGPLTEFELDGWAARRMGDRPSETPPGSAIPDADKAVIIRATGGLLPTLEFVRKCFRGNLPDPFTSEQLNRVTAHVREKAQVANQAAKIFAADVPAPLRQGIQRLYQFCHDYDPQRETYSRSDLEALRDLEAARFGQWNDPERWNRLLEAALLTGLVQSSSEPGKLVVPHNSILGIIVQRPLFADQS